MSKYVLYIMLAAACITGGDARAAVDFKAGISLNSSSNMLLRPDGMSGTMSSAFMETVLSHGAYSLSYNLTGGLIQHYDGIQFHSHTYELSKMLKAKESFLWNAAFGGRFSRFGDVTSLDGYHQEEVASNLKMYLNESLLFRWRGSVGQRLYSVYGRESYRDVSTVFRLDRFFQTGTSLRGQVDAGLRSYYEQDSTPSTTLVGVSSRLAQSIRPGWGVYLESFARAVKTTSGGDSTKVFNRIFLDDVYKYSAFGFTSGSTWIIRRLGTLRFTTSYMRREYSDRQTSYFEYLPENGWDEDETTVLLSLILSAAFLPERLTPSIDLYHTNVKASFSAFTYDSTGLHFRLMYR